MEVIVVVDMDLARVEQLAAHLDRLRWSLGEAGADDVLHAELLSGMWGAPRECEVQEGVG